MNIIAEFDKHGTQYASLMNNKIQCGIELSSTSIQRSSSDETGMILTWNLTGQGDFITDNGSYKINDNTFCFRHPKLSYKLKFNSVNTNRRCFLILPKEIFYLIENIFPQISMLQPVFKISNCDNMLNEYLLLIETFKSTKEIETFETFPMIFRFISKFLSLIPDSSEEAKIKDIHSLLKSNFTYSLSELADIYKINYNTFRKKFCEMYGMPPGKYRNLCKIEKAKILLANNYTCAQISNMLNYVDVYTFSHQFKLITGCNPTNYKKTK